MCRLLTVNSIKKFDILPYLKDFAKIAKDSKEFQGDGWGIGYEFFGKMKFYHSLKPIWEDNINRFGKSNLIIVHARSAFNDDLKPVEHNMPFFDDKYSFIFNGELHGVKIKSEGKIGAEKIFNFIKRFDKRCLKEAIKKSNKIIENRSEYIKAMNYIITDSENIYINSYFNKDREYFTLYKKECENTSVICSERFGNDKAWQTIENKTITVIKRR
jgi:glutamine amidotransferase